MTNSALELVVAGTADAVLMVESEAKELTEDAMLGAVMFGHREMQKVIDGIIRLAEKAAKEPRDVKVDTYEDEAKALADIAEAALKEAYQIAEKAARHQRIETIRAAAALALLGDEEGKLSENVFSKLFKELESRVMRDSVIETAAASTDAISRPSVRSNARSACCQERMAAHCSLAANPRHR